MRLKSFKSPCIGIVDCTGRFYDEKIKKSTENVDVSKYKILQEPGAIRAKCATMYSEAMVRLCVVQNEHARTTQILEWTIERLTQQNSIDNRWIPSKSVIKVLQTTRHSVQTKKSTLNSSHDCSHRCHKKATLTLQSLPFCQNRLDQAMYANTQQTICF